MNNTPERMSTLSPSAISSAIEAGLALTDPESDLLDVFRKQAGGIMVLRTVLNNIATGQLTLTNPKSAPTPTSPKKVGDPSPSGEEIPKGD